jgi:hypothetical protein
VVEPVAALLVDLRSRRVLLAWGAAGVGTSLVLLGAADTYVWLVLAFAVYGLGSGPLVHTAEVVLVESFPDDAERVFARVTFIDTIGALLGPLIVAAALAAGISWRVPVVAAGVAAVVYAAAMALTGWPRPTRADGDDGTWSGVRANVRAVLTNPSARGWLLFLFAFDLFEAPGLLRYVWLHDQAGLGTGQVALYAAGEKVVAAVALVVLDRWLGRLPWRRTLTAACVALAVLTPAWLYAPSLPAKVAAGLALTFPWAAVWPVGRARALLSVPGRSGTVTAVTTLFPLLPLTIGVAGVARLVGLTAALLIFMVAGALAMLTCTRRLARTGEATDGI